MLNLFEIMQQAQGGQAMNNLSRQFGLSQNQTQNAVEALLPAFQMGLERQTQNADMFSTFIQNLASGQHGPVYDRDGDGIPDEVVPQGNDVLGQLFGGKEVSRAVAAQAAMSSGISGSILKAMLPVIASMVMGGLFKGMNNKGFGDILGQLAGQAFGQGGGMGGGMGNQNAQADNPLGQILGGLFGGQGQGQPQNPMGGAGGGMAGGGGLGGMLGQVLGGIMGGQQPQQQAQPHQSDMMQAGLEALTNMFNAGTQAQATQQQNMQSIFEQMMGGGRR
jgi:hypothetical protein